MEIKVIIEAPGIVDAVNNLADAIRNPGIKGTTPQVNEPKKRASRKAAAVQQDTSEQEEAAATAPTDSAPDVDAVAEMPASDVKDTPTSEPNDPSVEDTTVPTQPAVEESTAPAQPVEDKAPTADPAPASAPEKKSYTLADLSNAGASLLDANPNAMNQLINMMASKYGVQALQQLKPEVYDQFAEDLKALGAKF